MPSVILTIYQLAIGAAYGFGGAVHVMNLTGRGPEPPVEKRRVFRALDVLFLVLNTAVVIGLLTGSPIGLWAFFSVAGLQLLMYTAFAGYFASDTEQRAHLRGLVRFHLFTATLMGILLMAS